MSFLLCCAVCRNLNRIMRRTTIRSSSSDQKHMDRTQDSTRSEVVSEVVVTEVHQLSPTVKGYTLHVENRQLKFKAGQWVDLHIPGENIVGGYSITSTPNQLNELESISLAIQYSQHPPTHWMSTRCKVGDKLSIRVGGDFNYAPSTTSDVGDLLLIGGGVGINPLFSMLQHHVWLTQVLSSCHQRQDSIKLQKDDRTSGHVCLLYSAKTKNELQFKNCIDEMASHSKILDVTYFVTNEREKILPQDKATIKTKRISADDIQQAIGKLNKSVLQCYICGPPPLTEQFVHVLTQRFGIDSDSIHFEKWW